MLELSTHSGPLIAASSNIDRVVDKTELIVGPFVFELIAVLLSEINDEVDDLRRCVRNLDGVSLDVCDRETTILNCFFQVDHEQSTTLGYDVVFITVIPKWVVKLRACESVDNVDDDLKSV